MFDVSFFLNNYQAISEALSIYLSQSDSIKKENEDNSRGSYQSVINKIKYFITDKVKKPIHSESF